MSERNVEWVDWPTGAGYWYYCLPSGDYWDICWSTPGLRVLITGVSEIINRNRSMMLIGAKFCRVANPPGIGVGGVQR